MDDNKMTNELQHHGIKGMRWGVRRFQNKDGSLTPLGERRMYKLQEKDNRDELKNRILARKLSLQKVKQDMKQDTLDREQARKLAAKKAKSDTKTSDDDLYDLPEGDPDPAVKKQAVSGKQMATAALVVVGSVAAIAAFNKFRSDKASSKKTMDAVKKAASDVSKRPKVKANKRYYKKASEYLRTKRLLRDASSEQGKKILATAASMAKK